MSHRISWFLYFVLCLLFVVGCSTGNSGFGTGVDDDDDVSNDDDTTDGDHDDAVEMGAVCWTIYIQDGTSEAWGAYWVSTEYFDGQGLPLRSVFDFDGDGPDRITDYFWAETGLLDEVREDSDADGKTDVEWFHTYDTEGNHIETTQVTQGVPEWIQSRAYDLENRVILEEMDSELDEVIDSRRTYEYEGDARSPKETWDDHDGDGLTDLLTNYLYSDLGPPTRVEEDDGADGVVERAWVFTLDELGRETQIDHDEDGDGYPDRVFLMEYDPGGSRSFMSEDKNADGEPEQFWRWHNTYDEEGRRATSLHDYGDDGVIDGEESWIYECVR